MSVLMTACALRSLRWYSLQHKIFMIIFRLLIQAIFTELHSMQGGPRYHPYENIYVLLSGRLLNA